MTAITAPMLVLRDAQVRGGRNAFDGVHEWLRVNFLREAADWQVAELPARIDRWDGLRLMVPFVLDPVQLWSPEIYQHLLALQQTCDAHRIPVINRVDRLERAGKLQAARAVAAAGLRAPRMVRIEDAEAFMRDRGGLPLPFMLRENWGHGGAMRRIERDRDLTVDLIRTLANPVAVEIVDVRSPADGLYRAYRYLACGPLGVSVHLHRSANWVTRGSDADASEPSLDEHRRYIEGPDPHHDQFQTVARLLGLDVLAFDYGYDLEGRVVVWEVNPYTRIRFPRAGQLGAPTAAHRAAAALVTCCRARAGLPVSRDMLRLLGYAGRGLSIRPAVTATDP